MEDEDDGGQRVGGREKEGKMKQKKTLVSEL